MKPCRLCAQPITGERTRLGYTGCMDCEQLHLFSELAEGSRNGTMPTWWINPEYWDDQQAHRAIYEAIKWEKR